MEVSSEGIMMIGDECQENAKGKYLVVLQDERCIASCAR